MRSSAPASVRVAAAALVVATLGLVACSGDADGDAAVPPASIAIRVPETVDETCDDPVGDLSTLAREEGRLGEPAGVDLVQGRIRLDGSELVLDVTTNGELAAAPAPTITLFQGPPGMQGSWELRAELLDGAWATTLITYAPGQGQILIDEVRQPVEATVTVDGSSFSLALPRSSVPPPLTVAWVFGASSTVASSAAPDTAPERTDVTVEAPVAQETTFDECDTLFTDALGGDEPDDDATGTTAATTPP